MSDPDAPGVSVGTAIKKGLWSAINVLSLVATALGLSLKNYWAIPWMIVLFTGNTAYKALRYLQAAYENREREHDARARNMGKAGAAHEQQLLEAIRKLRRFTEEQEEVAKMMLAKCSPRGYALLWCLLHYGPISATHQSPHPGSRHSDSIGELHTLGFIGQIHPPSHMGVAPESFWVIKAEFKDVLEYLVPKPE